MIYKKNPSSKLQLLQHLTEQLRAIDLARGSISGSLVVLP